MFKCRKSTSFWVGFNFVYHPGLTCILSWRDALIMRALQVCLGYEKFGCFYTSNAPKVLHHLLTCMKVITLLGTLHVDLRLKTQGSVSKCNM